MSGLELIIGAIGTGISTLGTIQAGREQKARFEYDQKVAKQQGQEAFAAGQRDAATQRRETEMVLSRQRAAIAGSGGSLADASVLDIMGDTAAEGDLAARTTMFKADQQRRGYNDAAAVAGVNAKNAQRASMFNAGAQLFSGVSSMYSRFGQPAKARAGTASNVTLPYG